MPVQLAESNCVIGAKQFNSSIFSQIWLVRNKILDESEFRPGCLFSDDVAKIESDQFGLLILPPQLQFVPKTEPKTHGELVATKLRAVVHLLPETPYTGIGLNFHWLVWTKEERGEPLLRSLFRNSAHPVYNHFDQEDASFGAYLSQDMIGCRLNLNILPITFTESEKTTLRLRFAFNFHLDLDDRETNVPRIEEHLERWDEASSLAWSIVHELKEATR